MYSAVAYEAHPHRMDGVVYQYYSRALEAVVESALVTWVGLLLYEIETFAPTGGITVSLSQYLSDVSESQSCVCRPIST